MESLILFGRNFKLPIDNALQEIAEKDEREKILEERKLKIYLGRVQGRRDISRVIGFLDEEGYPEMRFINRDTTLEIYQGFLDSKLLGVGWLDPTFYNFDKIRNMAMSVPADLVKTRGYRIINGELKILDENSFRNLYFDEISLIIAPIPEISLKIFNDSLP